MSGPYETGAKVYREKGWLGVLPIGNAPRQKSPPPAGFTGANGRFPTDDDTDRWLRNGKANLNIGLRFHEDLLGIDIDDYGEKVGGETARAVEAVHGPLPATWRSTSRDPEKHRGVGLFRIRPGSITKDEVKHPFTDDSDVEIIRFGDRYLVVAPSIHPEGNPYRWISPEGLAGGAPDPDDPSIPFLPQEWVDHIEERCECFGNIRITVTDGGDPAEKARDEALAALQNHSSRHQGALKPVMALCYFRNRRHPKAAAYLEEVHAAFVAAVTAPLAGRERRTPAKAESEWERMTTQGRAAKSGVNEPTWSSTTSSTSTGPSTPPIMPNLPAAFWEARPALRKIRAAAWSRQRSPDAVFGGLLTLLAAALPHEIAFPAIVGSPSGTGINVCVVAPTGVGKSTGAGIARELAKTDADVRYIPGGTGEGMVETLFDMVPADPTAAKSKMVKRQTCHNLHAYIDEITKTISVGKREGATVFEMMRSAFTGQVLGDPNATAERRRIVPQGKYSIGILVSAQPHALGPLFEDIDHGTPNRFLYLSGVDPSIPAPGSGPSWPGQIDVGLPAGWNIKLSPPSGVVRAPWRYHVLVADEIALEIQTRDHAKVTGAGDGDPWAGHRDLIRLKVAFALAVLDRRAEVRADDWAMAEVVLDTSDAVRKSAQSVVAATASRRDETSAARQAERAVIVANRMEDNQIERLARRLTRRVIESPGEESESDLKRSLESSVRPLGGEAIAYAVEKGWIEVRVESGNVNDKQRYWPGAVRMPK